MAKARRIMLGGKGQGARPCIRDLARDLSPHDSPLARTEFPALYQDVNVRATCFLIVCTLLAAPQLGAQRIARLLGRVVRDDSVSVSLPNAEIRIDATDLVTRSDSQGGFRFDSVPGGRYVVSARRPGFAPFSSAQLFRPGETTELRIRMAAVPNELAEVRVEERRPLSIGMRGFEERRQAKVGKFVGPEEIERYTGPTLSGLIRSKIQGFDLVSLITHGYMSGGYCAPGTSTRNVRGHHMDFSDSHNGDFDETGSGNDALDQAAWDFFAKAGWDRDDWDDDSDIAARAQSHRQTFKALLAVASPQERLVLKTALSHLKAGKEINWEAVARGLGKTSGAVKTQVRRAVAKLERGKR